MEAEDKQLDADDDLFSEKWVKWFKQRRLPWFETPEEIEAGLTWGVEKAGMLRWVRRHMRSKLTQRERRCVELYFFKGMTYREAGAATDTSATSVYRAVRRSLRKLRVAAKGRKRPPRRSKGKD